MDKSVAGIATDERKVFGCGFCGKYIVVTTGDIWFSQSAMRACYGVQLRREAGSCPTPRRNTKLFDGFLCPNKECLKVDPHLVGVFRDLCLRHTADLGRTVPQSQLVALACPDAMDARMPNLERWRESRGPKTPFNKEGSPA